MRGPAIYWKLAAIRKKEGHVQMAKYRCVSGGDQGGGVFLTALDFAEEVIASQRRLKLKENREPNLIAQKEILEAQGTSKILELYRVICEFPGQTIEIELGKKRKIETEWEFLEGCKKVNSADQINQLNALRFKTQMESKNLAIETSGNISGNEMPGMMKQIAKEEMYNKYGDAARKVEIGAICETWGVDFCEFLLRRYREANP